MKCDFCADGKVMWFYESKSFIISISLNGKELGGLGSDEKWAACDACARLIDAEKKEELSRRCVKFMKEKSTELFGIPDDELLFVMESLHDGFWRGKHGPKSVYLPAGLMGQAGVA